MNNPSSIPVALPPKRIKRPILSCVIFGIIAITAFLAFMLLIWTEIFTDRVRVEANSNEPTLNIGDYLVVDRSPNKVNEIKRGDFVMIFWNQNPSNAYIYRVIGMPGDSISLQSGKVYVNEKLLTEPYISTPPTYNGSWKVPTNQLFVLGDNRNRAADSHVRGFVPFSNVIGKALVVYWPVNHFQILK